MYSHSSAGLAGLSGSISKSKNESVSGSRLNGFAVSELVAVWMSHEFSVGGSWTVELDS